jgi:hypothetical protein
MNATDRNLARPVPDVLLRSSGGLPPRGRAQGRANMAIIAAWILVILGLGHTAVGVVRFKKPLAEAMRAGFVGQFAGHPDRHEAFWFMIFGPLLVMGGHLAIHAVKTADARLLKTIGFYLLAITLVGSLAAPKSPFSAGLAASAVLICTGYGWLP